jgi:hypothetical protein
MTFDEALNIIIENTPLEIISRVDETPDFYQFVGEAGGDILTYRVYRNGTLAQR